MKEDEIMLGCKEDTEDKDLTDRSRAHISFMKFLHGYEGKVRLYGR